MTTRRNFLKLASTGLVVPLFTRNRKILDAFLYKDIVLTDEAIRIHRSSIVIDGHNDFPSKMRLKGYSSFQNLNFRKNLSEFNTDIPRIQKGGIRAQFWVADGGSIRKSEREKSNYDSCLEDILLIKEMANRYSDVFEMAYSYDDILRIYKKGLVASLIGIEGGYAIGNSLSTLESFYKLGVRYLTLTWCSTNDLVDSATDKPIYSGLSQFGEKVVLEMNRLGMLVDISHITPNAMRHVLRVSQAPIIASHSSVQALCKSVRNIPDDVLQSISKNDGVIMINFFPGYLTEEGAKIEQGYWDYFHQLENDRNISSLEIEKLLNKWDDEHPVPKCSVERVVDHIDYIVKNVGLDYVGLGSDFDGIPFGPNKLDDVSYFPYITQILLNRGYTEDSIHKILGGNFLRVFKKVEEFASNAKK